MVVPAPMMTSCAWLRFCKSLLTSSCDLSIALELTSAKYFPGASAFEEYASL